MENTFENVPTPENEVVEQPVEQVAEQPAEKKLDVAEMANAAVAKAKDLIANKDTLVEKIKAIPSKIWIMAGAAVVALVAVIVALSLMGNTYKTPIQNVEKLLNTKSITKIIDNAPSVLNKFGEAEAEKALKIIKKSDQYEDAIEDAEDAFDTLRETLADEFGKNFKINLKVTEKEKLEKEDVKEFRDQLREIGDYGTDLKDMESDDYEDMADALGITKSQAKELINLAKDFCKECKSAKVSAGYELTVAASITGSEVDEAEETEIIVRVFKVDGRWVPDVFSLAQEINIYSLIYALGMY